MNGLRSPLLTVLLIVLTGIMLPGCVSREPRQLVPSITLSPETVSLSNGETSGNGLNFGMSTAVNESDSLSNVTVLPGVRVRTVSPNGAADLAGIRAGDVILAIAGREINHPDLLEALTLQDGAAQDGAAQSFVMQVRRNTTVFETTLDARAIIDARAVPVELYRVDPTATRAGYTTEVYAPSAGQARSGARVVRLFPESPLPGADLRIGDTILALDGMPVHSAQHFITRLHTEFTLGDRVQLTVLRDVDGSLELLEKSLRLWDPGRRVSRVALGPLLRYESSLSPQQTRLSIGDLWLFSLFTYEHAAGETEYNLLSLFRFATGYGELVEEPGP